MQERLKETFGLNVHVEQITTDTAKGGQRSIVGHS